MTQVSAITSSQAFGDTFYSGTVDNIRRVVDMLSIGEGRKSSFSEQTCKIYQEEADRIINGRMRSYCATPLVKVSDSKYPAPIPFIAARITAANIVLSEFSEIDANESEAATGMRDAALDQLDRLTVGLIGGTQRLIGQRIKTRNRFVSPGAAPQYEANDMG